MANEHLAITPSRQVRLRYTGDGSMGAAGFPADPDQREFSMHLTETEIKGVVATGIYEHVADEDEAAPAASTAYAPSDDDADEKED